MGNHAKRSPSAAKRWLNCPGCIRLADGLPEAPSSIYALEGSAAHYLAEKCLKEGKPAAHMEGKKITVKCDVTGNLERFEVDDDMIVAVQKYLDECQRQLNECPGAQFEVEQKLDAGWIARDVYGTGDFVIIDPLSSIRVIDYKHGRGVPVDVEDNPQLKIYALGALGQGNPYMVSRVILTIVQPRSFHPDGPIRTISYDVAQLVEWGSTVLARGNELTYVADAPLKQGDWCRWCDAKDPVESHNWPGCPEIERQITTRSMEIFGTMNPAEITIADPVSLTAFELDKRLAMADLFEVWIAGVRGEAFKRLENNSPGKPTTYKLVEGKSNRVWTDEEAVKQIMDEMRMRVIAYSDPKLKTPSQLETALKKQGLDAQAILGSYINKPKGKATMVPIDDPREPLTPTLEELFGKPETT